MKLCLRSLTLAPVILGIVAVVTGCSPKPESSGSRTYQIPWPTAAGTYEIQNVEIKSFNEPAYLRGEWAEIFIGPSGDSDGLTGSKPVGRFTEKSDGVLVPADLATLQATTIYAHLERLREIDLKLGVATSFVWPAKVGIKVNYLDHGSYSRNNAYYDSRLNAIIVVPYTSAEIPLTFNAGVLAHEHFHAIFQDGVINAVEANGRRTSTMNDVGYHSCGMYGSAVLPETEDKNQPLNFKLGRKTTPAEFNSFLLRALNEGVADFWGWMYTNDSDFISHSLSNVGTLRSLDSPLEQLESSESKRSDMYKGGSLREAYRLGSGYARFLKRLAVLQSGDGKTLEQAKLEVAQALLAAFPVMAKDFSDNFEAKLVSTDIFLKPLYANLASLSVASCALHAEFSRFSEQPTGCKKLVPLSLPALPAVIAPALSTAMAKVAGAPTKPQTEGSTP